jgi:hypothetical protein
MKLKSCFAAALCCAVAGPGVAREDIAGGETVKLVEYRSEALPPADYSGQWWTSPDNCQYSRAGRPGETVWYLIVNTAHDKCARRLIQRAYSDYN